MVRLKRLSIQNTFQRFFKKTVCDIYIYLSPLIRSSFEPSNLFFEQIVFLSQHWFLKSAFFPPKTFCLSKAKGIPCKLVDQKPSQHLRYNLKF